MIDTVTKPNPNGIPLPIDQQVINTFLVDTVGLDGNGGWLEIFDNYSKSKFFKDLSPEVFTNIESITKSGRECHFGTALRKEKLTKVSTDANVLNHSCYRLDFDTDKEEDKIYEKKYRMRLETEQKRKYTHEEIIGGSEKAKRRAKEILDKFLKKLPQHLHPTYFVDSGHGYQCFWVLKEPEEDLNLWSRVQATLVNHSGGDPTVKDHRRIMRVPGTTNFKYPEAPAPVTIVEANPERKFNTQDFIDFFDMVGFQLVDLMVSKSPTGDTSFSDPSLSKTDILRRLPERIKQILKDGERHPKPTDTDHTMSARDWSVFQAVIAAGAANEVATQIFRESACATLKPARSYDGDRYIQRKILQARSAVAEVRRANYDLKLVRKRNERGKLIFDPVIEAEIFLKDRYLLFVHERLHEYKDEYYRPLPDRYFLDLITKQLWIFNSRQHKAREILEVLKNRLTDPDIDSKINPDPRLLNVMNGLFDIRTMELRPHTPEYLSTYRVNASYLPGASCPRFNRFINEVLVNDGGSPDNEVISVLQEFTGLCLLPKIILHKGAILYGGGSNGKSVYESVTDEFLKGHVSYVHFESISQDVFATSDLAGALLNISSEISANAVLQDSQVKTIISGGTIRAQRKNQQAFDFRPVAKYIITANNLPRSSDKSFGFFRRFLIIPFNQTFLSEKEIQQLPEDDRQYYKVAEPNLEETLFNEMDGIFLWALEGLERLLRNKEFTYSSQIDALNKVFKIRSTTVESFLKDRVDQSEITRATEFSKLFQAYVSYCKGFQLPPLTNRRFATELRNQGLIVEKGTDNKTFVRGVSLMNKENETNELPF